MIHKIIARNYSLCIAIFIVITTLSLIKAEWIEIPHFSHNKKIYRASVQLDRLNKFSIGEREKFDFPLKSAGKFERVSQTEKTGYPNKSEHLIFGNDTISLNPTFSIAKYPKGLEATTAVVTASATTIISENYSEENNQTFQDYYYDEYSVEGAGYTGHNKQKINLNNSKKNELFTTCTSNELQTNTFSNISTHPKKQYLNKSTTKSDKHLLQYLPIKVLKRVHLILNVQPTTLHGKINFLRNIEKVLMSEVESRLALTIFSLRDRNEGVVRNRKRRNDHHEDDSLGFPSLEGALMAISFLTFAIYLVRLIMMLFQNFNNNTGTATIFLGRRRKSVDYLNENTIRILSYLNK